MFRGLELDIWRTDKGRAEVRKRKGVPYDVLERVMENFSVLGKGVLCLVGMRVEGGFMDDLQIVEIMRGMKCLAGDRMWDLYLVGRCYRKNKLENQRTYLTTRKLT